MWNRTLHRGACYSFRQRRRLDSPSPYYNNPVGLNSRMEISRILVLSQAPFQLPNASSFLARSVL